MVARLLMAMMLVWHLSGRECVQALTMTAVWILSGPAPVGTLVVVSLKLPYPLPILIGRTFHTLQR